jgi:hypothetical protein
MDIIILKVGSDEVIGRIVSNEPEYYVLEKARLFVPTAGPNGMELSAMPYFISSPDSKCIIYKRSVVGEVVNIPKQLEDMYLMQTTGLQIAS